MDDKLYKKALNLEYFTVVYNVLEALLSIFFGASAGSIALVGFGLDSIVESLSGLVLIWRLRKHSIYSEKEEMESEKKAIKLVAITFFLLAAYVLYESAKKLILTEIPKTSLPGIIISIFSIVIMPVLSFKKHNLGIKINSKALVADSKETLVCAFLSMSLLLGLTMNYLFGFWQADTLEGLIVVVFFIRKGQES
jgi:divalent metal cation (Fe/Co/Zn/Cd) transporter